MNCSQIKVSGASFVRNSDKRVHLAVTKSPQGKRIKAQGEVGHLAVKAQLSLQVWSIKVGRLCQRVHSSYSAVCAIDYGAVIDFEFGVLCSDGGMTSSFYWDGILKG